VCLLCALCNKYKVNLGHTDEKHVNAKDDAELLWGGVFAMSGILPDVAGPLRLFFEEGRPGLIAQEAHLEDHQEIHVHAKQDAKLLWGPVSVM